MNLPGDNLSGQSSECCNSLQVFVGAPPRQDSSTWTRAPVSAVLLPSPTCIHSTSASLAPHGLPASTQASPHSQMEICFHCFLLGFLIQSLSNVMPRFQQSGVRMFECWSLKRCIMAVQESWNVSTDWTDWWMPLTNCNHHVEKTLFLVWPLDKALKS